MSSSPHLPLTHALAWIVGSMLLVNGSAYMCLKMVQRRATSVLSEDKLIRSIVQTGPQKEALKTEYLAEVLGICADFPPSVSSFQKKKAEELLRSSPLISQAKVSLLKPNILYIDYTARQPVAFLADYENVAIDKEGYLFPFAPFFSPKNLPEIYLGLAPFGMPNKDPDKPTAQWGTPLKGKYMELALQILSIATDGFNITWIDVSHAFSKSCGKREIIVATEDVIFERAEEGKCTAFRTLRLSTKNFAQELGNYVALRPQLLEEDRRKRALPGHDPQKRIERIIDFRIPNLAFVE